MHPLRSPLTRSPEGQDAHAAPPAKTNEFGKEQSTQVSPAVRKVLLDGPVKSQDPSDCFEMITPAPIEALETVPAGHPQERVVEEGVGWKRSTGPGVAVPAGTRKRARQCAIVAPEAREPGLLPGAKFGKAVLLGLSSGSQAASDVLETSLNWSRERVRTSSGVRLRSHKPNPRICPVKGMLAG